MNAKSYKTQKGTELPLLNLKGKQYLEVKYRLVWFREDHPEWSIETEMMNVTDVSAYARATIRDDKGRIIATSHKFESVQGFPDFIEKAETGSIGRALALIGYGTQFCADELDEGSRIVDAPADRPRRLDQRMDQPQRPATRVASIAPVKAVKEESNPEAEAEPEVVPQVVAGEPGEFMINFGRKYKGMKLKDVPKTEIEGYIKWLENSDVRPGTALASQVGSLKSAFGRFYQERVAQANH